MRVCVVLDGLGGERAKRAAYVLRTLLTALGLPHEIVAGPRANVAGPLVVRYGPSGHPGESATAGWTSKAGARRAHGWRANRGTLALVEIACQESLTAASPLTWLVGVGANLVFAQPGANTRFAPTVNGAQARGVLRPAVVLGTCDPVEGEPLYRETAQGRAVVAAEGSRIRIGADLVASAGLWLTGGDEGPGGRDAFRRFRGAASARAQAGLLRTPVVTDLMWLLWEALDKAARGAGLRLERMPAWPQGRKFAVLLSHDVDLWRKRTVRQLGKELARSVRAPRRLPKLARCFCCGPDPWSDLDGIADLEERRGMRSTFFLLPGRPDRVLDGVRIVNSYDARPERVRDTARRLVARGWEVGLHGSFDSFDSAEALAGESRDVAALAGQPVAGCRQHFLRFERPTTWRRQAEAGLRYDATLGYHDADGYRAGFSFPFRPFANEELPLLELPLVVADGALREHQGLDAEAAWQRLQGYLERTEADGAMLSLLWHNTHFCELDAPGYRGVYERALDWTQEHGGWGASAREIAEWWEQRSASLQRME